MPHDLTQALVSRISSPTLTTRELEVLRFVRLGISNKENARRLDVVEGTIKSHVREILSKLRAISRTEAVNLAIQRGLLK
jgi:DNA-binding NarL/FixJ family response regulator